MIIKKMEAEAVMACGQQIVCGFYMGVTPSWTRPQDILLGLWALAEPTVASSLTDRSGFDVSGWWWWSDETSTLTPCLYPSSPTLSFLLPSHSCLFLLCMFVIYLFWSFIPHTPTMSPLFSFSVLHFFFVFPFSVFAPGLFGILVPS